MRRLGKTVRSNHKGYCCELLDGNGEVIGYAVFSSDGSHVRNCSTIEEAESELENIPEPTSGMEP
jgi:hypothetical protein